MSAMDANVVEFYRQIYADLAVDSGEAAALTDFLTGLNPPPDKLLWMRATAFRVASEFLGDDKDSNVSLLRTANFIVHAIETNCMQPRALDGAGPVDEEALSDFYKTIFEDMTVNSDENAGLIKFFKEDNPPDADSMVTVRATVFKVACDFLSDDDKDHNTQLLRCINVVVHAFEMTCLSPKPFELKEEEVMNLDVDLPEAVNQLWALDANRLDPNRDYTINVQEGKKPYWAEDKAEDPLFSYVDQSVLRRPTYSAFIALLDNYSSETGIEEVVTHTERAEVKKFLRRVMETKPMQFCHRYCHAKNPDLVPSSRDGFIGLLQKIWFDLYHRSTARDSSGFEHVFVGEVKVGLVFF
uniref:EndoU domain-containing protein n=1 Tax=Amphora coffeiformis TaxID=265554 RepID=A0A7S3P3J0_9STRA